MRTRLAALAVASCLACMASLAQAQQVVDLRGSAAAPPPQALAAWEGAVDLPAVVEAGVGDVLWLALPEGRAAPFRLRRVADAPDVGRSWHAVSEDGAEASLVLSRVGDAWAGAIWHPEWGTFEIRPTPARDAAGRRVSRVLLMDPDAPWECAAGPRFGLEGRAPVAGDRAGHDHEPIDAEIGAWQVPAAGSEIGCGCPESGETVDVMVAYSGIARAAAGGTDEIEAVALASVASMNESLDNSEIPVQIQLVHLVETPYDESAHDHPGDMRTALRVNGDGHMDELHALRQTHKADVVALLVDDLPLAIGAAYPAMGNPGTGFSVTEWDSAVALLVFAHELGHHFGTQHDYPNEDLISELYYGFGHTFYDARDELRRTIMAYPPATVVPHFSNPDVSFDGEPTGRPIDGASPRHNAEVILRYARSVANLLDSGEGFADCNANGVSDCEDIGSGDSLDENANGLPDECEVRLYVDADAAPGGDGLSWATAFDSLSDAIGEPRFQCDYVTEVWVAEGTYRPTGPQDSRRDRFFVGPRMSVLGGFAGDEASADERDPAAHPTVVTADRLGNDEPGFDNRADNSYGVFRVIGSIGGSLIDGFTIRGGFTPIGPGNANGVGAALLLTGASEIDRCTITDNRAEGGTIASYGSERVTLSNSLVHANEAVLFGAGVLALETAELDLINSTVTGNSAGDSGGGILATHDAQVEISNSILWDNAAPTGHEITIASIGAGEFPVTVSIAASDVQGGPDEIFNDGSGTIDYLSGNIDADPLFTDAAEADFALLAGSPAIDAGDNGAVPDGVLTDLAGNDRIAAPIGADPVVDMGAYELQPCTADCDGSGGLNVLDFLCFQDAYQAGDDGADVNGDGELSVLDFVAFQEAFVAGCG